MSVNELIEASRAAMENAYAPYSGFRVGAAILGANGRVYTGCNVENASYGLTACAERNAVASMVADGERVAEAAAISCSGGKAAPPCGACRQVLAEFAPRDRPMKVYLVSDEGVETHTLDELLPDAFKL